MPQVTPQSVSSLNPHARSSGDVLEALNSSAKGLTSQEASDRLELFGSNALPGKSRRHVILLFLSQFNSFLIYILMLAAAVSWWIDQYVDMWLIIAIIVINAVIGFIQEYRAERSIEALKKMIVPTVHVFRDGDLTKSKAADLVPGDVILLQEGDRIPADARILESTGLTSVESALTGESMPVEKGDEVFDTDTPIADQGNMVWMGTIVGGGEGMAVVTATGRSTSIGEVAQSLEDIDVRKGTFWKKTRKLALQLALIAIAGAIITFVVGYFIRKIAFEEIFLFTLAALVAGIPEGLPAVIIIVLAIGASRMAKKNVIIRSLPATETLGQASVIATDKTGTLTQNTMNVEAITLPDGTSYSVSGKGWETSGKFYKNDQEIDPSTEQGLQKILRIAALCSGARLVRSGEESDIIGDPTEAALVVMAAKAGYSSSSLNDTLNRIHDLPFNKERRYRASLVEDVDSGEREIFVVGAPETILQLSVAWPQNGKSQELENSIITGIQEQIARLASEGMRVLALAWRKDQRSAEKVEDPRIRELTFAGIVGMRDPVRSEVAPALEEAVQAGIRVVMKTGDHKKTAVAIAREIGLAKDGDADAITESDIEAMDESQFQDTVEKINIYARLTPRTKLRIIEALQNKGEIVAMTGDGVNDAPALKKSDIGIAMGKVGTDVARGASAMVLADDNFASIINAVREGRIVFSNIRRVTWFLVATNVAEAVTIITALSIGYALPLLPVHILWLNIITDGLVVLALATEPGHRDVLKQRANKNRRDILTREVALWFLMMAIVMTGCTLFVFDSYLNEGLVKARTGAFATMAICQLFNVLNMRSISRSIFSLGFFTNRLLIWAIVISLLPLAAMFYIDFLQGVFRFSALTGSNVIEIVLLSSLVLWTGELYKLIRRKWRKSNNS